MASLAQILEEEATPLSPLELPVKSSVPLGERRFLPRVAGRFEVHCSEGSSFSGVDLSFGGLLCVGEEPLWPGNVLGFAISLPGEARLYVTGRVVELVSYRGRVGMRVRFVDIDTASQKRIAAWMARTAPRP